MTGSAYDVANPPTAEEWLAMDEGHRIAAVEDAHRRTRASVGQNAAAHASMHVVIENRLAMGHRAVIDAYERFCAAGVDRHNTIHALASVASDHMLAVLEQRADFDQTTADAAYAALDPERWKPKPKR
jgi:hypothetical protein